MNATVIETFWITGRGLAIVLDVEWSVSTVRSSRSPTTDETTAELLRGIGRDDGLMTGTVSNPDARNAAIPLQQNIPMKQKRRRVRRRMESTGDAS